jgi:hypothetical protein
LTKSEGEITSKEKEVADLKASFEKERDQNLALVNEVKELKSQAELHSILESSTAEQQEYPAPPPLSFPLLHFPPSLLLRPP